MADLGEFEAVWSVHSFTDVSNTSHTDTFPSIMLRMERNSYVWGQVCRRWIMDATQRLCEEKV